MGIELYKINHIIDKMANRFEIIQNALVVTDTVTSAILFEELKEGLYYGATNLEDGYIYISSSYTASRNLASHSSLLEDAVNSLDVAFTKESFILFARGNLGFKLADNRNNLPLSAFGDLRTVELSPVFQYTFEYTVDNTELTESVLVNGGTVTQSEAMGVISTSTTASSMSCLQSKRQAKYRSGQGALVRFTALFESSGIVGTSQLAGLVDEDGSAEAFKNGYTVGFIGTTFGVHRFSNDTLITVALADCDDPLDGTGISGMVIDTAKLNVFEIRFQYLGAGAIEYWIEDDSTGMFIQFHKILYANKNVVPSIYMPNLRMMLYADNGVTTNNLVVKTASFAYFVEGKTELTQVHQPQQTTGTQTKTSVTGEVPILTIRNKILYAGKNNYIELIMELVASSVEASNTNNLAEIRFIGGGTLGGAPVWNDINTNNSIVEMDIVATSITGGKELLTIPLAGKNDKDILNVLDFKFLLSSGESITIAGSSAGAATLKASALWKELF